MRVGVVGLGKLGVPYAAVLAEAGHTVTGADADPLVVARVALGVLPPEPDMPDLPPERFTVAESVRDLAAETDIVLIVVPTPSGDDGRFDASAVADAAGQVAQTWDDQDRTGIIVVVSTVMPGSCDGEIADAITEGGLDPDTALAYSPALIALGSVVNNLRRPDLLLIGANDEATGDTVENLLRSVARNAPVYRMNRVSTEIAKLSINVFLCTKVSYANSVARVCEQFPGADAVEVCEAVGADSRVGHKFLQPSTAYGGGCLCRDTTAFSTLGFPWISDAVEHVNDLQIDWLYRQVVAHRRGGGNPLGTDVMILGMAYKPGTPVTDQSPGMRLAKMLHEDNIPVTAHDPQAGPLGLFCRRVKDLTELEWHRVVVVATPWDEYHGLKPNEGQTIIDPWRICQPGAGTLVVPGVGP